MSRAKAPRREITGALGLSAAPVAATPKPKRVRKPRPAPEPYIAPPPEIVEVDGRPVMLDELVSDSGWVVVDNEHAALGCVRWERRLAFPRLPGWNHERALSTWAIAAPPGPIHPQLVWVRQPSNRSWVEEDGRFIGTFRCEAFPCPPALPALVSDSGWIGISTAERRMRGDHVYQRDLVFASPVAPDLRPTIEAWLRGPGCPGYCHHRLSGSGARFVALTTCDTSD